MKRRHNLYQNINGTKNHVKRVIKTIPIIFITKPTLTMSKNLIFPLAKTIAFGGVPIGNIPATLAAKAMGTPNNKGLMCRASAIEETTGANTMTCATLLITSLIKIDVMVTNKTSKKILLENCDNHMPSFSINPAFSRPLARLIPPPKSNKNTPCHFSGIVPL